MIQNHSLDKTQFIQRHRNTIQDETNNNRTNLFCALGCHATMQFVVLDVVIIMVNIFQTCDLTMVSTSINNSILIEK